MTQEEKYKELLQNIVKAWESLEGDREYTPKEISAWLINKMSPSINKIRKELKTQTK